jgi:ribose 5-phosphate isomerase B
MFDKTKILAIGSDHAGYKLKEFLKKKLADKGYTVKDFGCESDKSVDYPDIIHPLSQSIENKEFEKGIIICGSGNGAQMTANKYRHIRAALCWNTEIAMLSRLHNDANIISLPARFIKPEEALDAVVVFLNSGFEGGRHKARVDKISNY